MISNNYKGSYYYNQLPSSFHFLAPDVLATENNPQDIGAKTDLLKYEARHSRSRSLFLIFLSRSCINMVESTVIRTRLVYHDLEKFSGKVLSLTVRHGGISVPRYLGFHQARILWNKSLESVLLTDSNFLYFLLQSARLNSQQEAYKDKPIFERYGPTFLTSMFVRLRFVVSCVPNISCF